MVAVSRDPAPSMVLGGLAPRIGPHCSLFFPGTVFCVCSLLCCNEKLGLLLQELGNDWRPGEPGGGTTGRLAAVASWLVHPPHQVRSSCRCLVSGRSVLCCQFRTSQRALLSGLGGAIRAAFFVKPGRLQLVMRNKLPRSHSPRRFALPDHLDAITIHWPAWTGVPG